MGTKVKLLAVNVALSAIAAFLGAVAVLPTDEPITKAALVAAGYAALRAAIGLGSVYADKLSAEVRAANEQKAGF
jgi:hypothetical protein